VEAECWSLDDDDDDDDNDNRVETQRMVSQVKELQSMSYEQALKKMKCAAYFAEHAMMGMVPSKRIENGREFLCPTLLRKFLPAPFDPDCLAKATQRPLMTNQEWTACDDISIMFQNLRRLPAEKYETLKLRKTIHKYLLASCDKHMDLLQSPMIQQGLIGTRQHLKNPTGNDKIFALWSYAFDEIFEHDSDEETEETVKKSQAQQLALAAINGSWPSDFSDGLELYSSDLLREFLPSPFDH